MRSYFFLDLLEATEDEFSHVHDRVINHWIGMCEDRITDLLAAETLDETWLCIRLAQLIFLYQEWDRRHERAT